MKGILENKIKVTLERKIMRDTLRLSLDNRRCIQVTWKTLLEIVLEMILGHWYILCNVKRTFTINWCRPLTNFFFYKRGYFEGWKERLPSYCC